jgi:ubiquinone/menaquinone biosynthesis C-methylase UbiE
MPLNADDAYLISFLDELPFWSAPFGIKIIDKIVPRKGLTILDIGFGTGFPLLELAMRLGNSCKVYGIDPWEAASERAKEKIKVYGIKNVEFLDVIPQVAYPLHDDSIDIIVSNNGLNNVQDLAAVLKESFRVLKPGGKLFFTMNLDGTMMEFYSVMEPILFTHGLFSSIDAMKKHIYEKRKPLDEIRSLLADCGFSAPTVEQDCFTYRFTDGTTMFNHFFIKLAFLDSWLLIVPEESRKEIFGEIEMTINKIAADKGFFRLSVPYVLVETGKS